jgi:RNA polymerase sigma-70 factor (ECF subfamily)
MADSDRETMERICRGDAAAFERAYARWNTRIRRHLTGMVRDEAAAEDLLQEVFLRLWTRADQWEGRGTVEAWLVAIATNLAINHLRSARHRKRRPLHPPVAPPGEEEEILVPGWLVDEASLGPPAVLERAERHRRVRRMVDELPEEKREVVRLIYQEQMDIRGAADALGIPEGTVKSRLYYARESLSRKLSDGPKEEE